MKNKTETQDPEEQYNLGVMHANGQGVPKDAEEAVKWFRLAAEQGNIKAQYHLGGMYFKGEGVTKDNKKAVKWYRLAAEQRYADAQFILGAIYANGEGVLRRLCGGHEVVSTGS